MAPASEPGKPVHKAALIGKGSKVSPLCAARPRAIDLRRATWTLRWAAVTCERCLALRAEEVENRW